MTTKQNFLVEIGTEELPPTALRRLGEAFAANLTTELEKADFSFEHLKWYASPRRLAIKIDALVSQQPDKIVEKRGPAIQAAFDADGKPTKAAEGWARSNGISVEQAERLVTDKGEWLLHKAEVKGQTVQERLPSMISFSLSKLPVPKMMRWGNSSIQFIRPVKTVTLLFGEQLIDAEILGVQSARIIRGHRFMGEPEITLNHADEYPARLESEGKVIADFDTRKSHIKSNAELAAKKVGGIADLEDDLLDEVTALVEWPVVLTASFETEFLKVPAEALVYTMKGDQKYFPVYNEQGQLLPKFIFVSNIESKDPNQVIDGNEKVVRPRLADAEFFFNNDRKRPLADRLEELSKVLFQKQLGTVKEKTERISQLAAQIAEKIDANVAHATRAGLLAKCDLVTDMVFEFTDTQGVMGMHYARHDGEPEDVALALKEQYSPRYSGDALPSTPVSTAVAIADKLDTLVGIFGIGQTPKGDKDPFALRRAALGVLRIIVEQKLEIDLVDLVQRARNLFGDKLTNQHVEQEVVDFMLGRFRAWYQDEDVSVDIIQAVLANRPTQPADFDRRIHAVAHFRSLEAATSLAAANKRVSNILAKYEGDLPSIIDTSRLIEAEEKTLAETVLRLQDELAPLFEQGKYQTALSTLASLKEPVDAFFDSVMVMADDESLKQNRLALLAQLRGLFLKVADISLLQG